MACTITGAGISAVHDGVITTAKFTATAKPIGVDQTWQNFTSAQRVFGTTYTNDTGRPITVNASCTSSTSYLLQAVVDGVTISLGPWSTGANSSAGSVVVPAGSTYKMQASAGTATFATWAELR